MNKAAIYVFSDAACMEYGFTMMSRYFKSRQEAEKYAEQSGYKFFRVVEW